MKYFLILITIMLAGVVWIDINESPKANPVKELTAEEKALRERLVGEYEHKFAGTEAKQRLVFQENGEVKLFRSHGKDIECKWFVVDGEIQIHPSQWGRGTSDIYRINIDDDNATKPITSITQIAGIRGGKREDYGRERTHEKIK